MGRILYCRSRYKHTTKEGANASRHVSSCSDTDKSPRIVRYLDRYMLTARGPALKALRDETYDEDHREHWEAPGGRDGGKAARRETRRMDARCYGCWNFAFWLFEATRASTRWFISRSLRRRMWGSFPSSSSFRSYLPFQRWGAKKDYQRLRPIPQKLAARPRQGRPLPIWSERGQIRLRRYEFEIP